MTSFLAVLLSLGALQAQSLSRQVIGSMGAYSEAANLSLSATAGQVSFATVIEDSLTLLQGFQQPDGFILASNVALVPLVVDYKIYPNPTTDLLKINMNSNGPLALKVSLADINGRAIPSFNKELHGFGNLQTNLKLGQLPSGIYLIQIRDQNGQLIKSHKVRKL